MKKNITFTKQEVRDLIITIIVATVIFSYVFGTTIYKQIGFYKIIPYVIVIIIITFVFHELAHKFVAQKFGCAAFYRMNPMWLIFSLILSLIFKIVILIPGAVMIYPFTFGRWGLRVIRLTVSENGLIALVGPLTNLIFALIFSFFTGTWFIDLLVFINAWLAFFNLLPIPPLDGSKIMQWKIWVWGIMIVLSFLLVFLR